MNVLIAEDDPDMQKILGLYLRREGYQVDTVGDGAAAVDFLAEHPDDAGSERAVYLPGGPASQYSGQNIDADGKRAE